MTNHVFVGGYDIDPSAPATCQVCERHVSKYQHVDREGSMKRTKAKAADNQFVRLERDLRDSLRGRYLFGNFDEPLDMAALRIVRVIQQRLSDLLCEYTDRTPDGARCRACGGLLIDEG